MPGRAGAFFGAGGKVLFHDLSAFANRLCPARPDLAAARLQGRVEAARFVEGTRRRVGASLLDLTLVPDPAAECATQLLPGEVFTVYETRDDGLAWGQCEADGYVGYVAAAGLGPDRPAGRLVTALWSHVYAEPTLRARVIADLPMLADVEATGTEGAYAALAGGGYVPAAHLAPVPGDLVAMAARLIGVPYLWGGRSARGIDCSGLVQLAMAAAGLPAPRDSDMQAALIGQPLDPEAPLQRGDLVFWRGHVGILTGADRLLHANAHAMAVAGEPLAEAVARITSSGGGPVTARRRPERLSGN